MSADPRGAQTTSRRGCGPNRATMWFGHLVAQLRLSFGLRVRAGKIGTWPFVSCNSENISRSNFLKPKNSRKQGTDTVASC